MPIAVIIKQNGGPEVFELREIERRKPNKGEVWIEQKSIGVNYLDINHRDGSVPVSLPSGIGIEGAGRVIDVGPEVQASLLGIA